MKLQEKLEGRKVQYLPFLLSRNVRKTTLKNAIFCPNEVIHFIKNGALLTINLGVFLKLAHSNFIYTSLMLTVFSVIAIASIVLSILVLLFSFIPKLNFQKTFNPIFFGSISKLDRNAFLKDVDKLKEKELVAYYWEQIHINSNIAMSKFVYFKRGVFLTILSFMSYGLINIIK